MSGLMAGVDQIFANESVQRSERSAALDIKSAILIQSLWEAAATFAIGLGVNFAYAYFFLGWSQSWTDPLIAALIVSAGIVGASVVRDHYYGFETRSIASATWTGLTASLRAFSLLIATLFVLKSSDGLSRGSVICQFGAVTAVMLWSRAFFYSWIRREIDSGHLVTGRLLVLGDSLQMVKLIAERGFCDRLRGEGKDVVRLLAWEPANGANSEYRFVADVIEQCRTKSVDCVVVVPNVEQALLAERVTAAFAETPVTVHILPFAGLGQATPGASQIGGQASVCVANAPMKNIGKLTKRVLDVALASALLVILLPLLITVAAAIKLDSPGPVFFRQGRHGYGNRHIRVFKFRSMRVMEEGKAFRQATRNDVRITRVGRFIRRTNLDELPQLLNVLAGDMSLVGPRPHPIALNDDFAARISLFHRRHNIMPGITGWAQVNGYRGETDTEEKMRKRVNCDLWYIDNWSLGLDLRILILTIFSSTAYRNAG